MKLVRILLSHLRRRRATGLAVLLYATDEFLDLLLPVLGDNDLVVMLDARAMLDVDPDGLSGCQRRVSGNTSARMRKEMRFHDAATGSRSSRPCAAATPTCRPIWTTSS